jgi:hypothetical protein
LAGQENNNISYLSKELISMTVASNVKKTLASLKGIESTLKIYSVQCRNEEEKSVYKEELYTVESVVGDIENRLKTLEFEEPQYKGN